LEATCWLGRPPGDVQEIIEIGAFKVNDFGEITGKFGEFVKPIVNPVLSPFCRQLTGITQSQVNTASTFDKVIDQFLAWADIPEEEYLLISWGNQDERLFHNDCVLHKVDPEWVHPVINIKDNYVKLKNLSKPISLKKAVEREGMDFEGNKHRALYDAHNLSRIFVKYFDNWNL